MNARNVARISEARRLRTAGDLRKHGFGFPNTMQLEVNLALLEYRETLHPHCTMAISVNAPCRLADRTIEADFVVFFRGHAGVIEVDGSPHNHKWADDCTRDALWRDSGVLVFRIPADFALDPIEARAQVRRFMAWMSA